MNSHLLPGAVRLSGKGPLPGCLPNAVRDLIHKRLHPKVFMIKYDHCLKRFNHADEMSVESLRKATVISEQIISHLISVIQLQECCKKPANRLYG